MLHKGSESLGHLPGGGVPSYTHRSPWIEGLAGATGKVEDTGHWARPGIPSIPVPPVTSQPSSTSGLLPSPRPHGQHQPLSRAHQGSCLPQAPGVLEPSRSSSSFRLAEPRPVSCLWSFLPPSWPQDEAALIPPSHDVGAPGPPPWVLCTHPPLHPAAPQGAGGQAAGKGPPEGQLSLCLLLPVATAGPL